MQRRELFTSFGKKIKGEKQPLSPPYLNGSLTLCKSCEAPCVEACETDVLFKNEQDLIEMSFASSGCTYCEACAEICNRDVLLLNAAQVSIQASIYIQEGVCLAHNGVMCMSCKEPCMDNAINFEGLFKPLIDPNACTSCGFCISRCPTAAIKVLV